MPEKKLTLYGFFSLYLLTIILAFCSMVYELLLAQTMAATLGNTILRYNTTIGLYLASLGIGSLIYPYGKNSFEILISRLFATEIILSISGGIVPALSVLFDYHFQTSPGIIFLCNHLLVLWIGFLSGFELPLLMDLADRCRAGLSRRILSFDYLGTLLGAISFPLFLFPSFGIFLTAAITGFINLLSAFFIYFYFNTEKSKKVIIFCMFLCMGFILFLSKEKVIKDFILKKYFLVGIKKERLMYDF
ncbi:hypothetical protein ACFL35_02210 [Candidatus Riflebacteria bacterium]